MTSPNRETEAQQVEARVEQTALTRVKASLGIKTRVIRVNLEQAKTITDQELAAGTGKLKISKPDLQEMVKEAALNQEKATAITSGQEQVQEEMEILKISKAGLQEMAKEAALNPEKVTAVISGQELVPEETEMPKILKADRREMARAAASDQKARGALVAPQVSNRVHSKKAVLKKCQEMKAAVM